MSRRTVIVNIVTLCFLKTISCQMFPYIPCPNVFSYEMSGGSWQGSIAIANPPPYGGTITLKVTLGLDARLATKYVGKIELTESLQVVGRLIRENRPIRYRVLFPIDNPLPRIVRILLNNNEICSGAESTEITTITLDHSLKTGIVNTNITPDTTPTPYVPNIPNVPNVPNAPPVMVPSRINDNICGTTTVRLTPLIFDGDEINRGEWPWLVAMFRKKNEDAIFTCAGTLISRTVVLTAAHCMFIQNVEIQPSDIILKFGAMDLGNDYEDNVQSIGVESFRTRRDFNKITLLNDIAVLVTSDPVTYNDYVRPVCLWSGSNSQNLVVGLSGTVIGWGQDQNGNLLTSGARSVPAPIVSTEACRGTDQFYYSNTSNKTLCAGTRDGRGPCRGDSGGGLYVKVRDRWMIRGIVSNSLPKPVVKCDLDKYVVYTDVSKFDSWIRISL